MSEPRSSDLSLEELEGHSWGEPPPGATYLMRTVHRLRRAPVESLDVEDLRILIGQQVGLDVLVPLALDRLKDDPLAEGDFYPGDLLTAVLRVENDFWSTHSTYLRDVKIIIATLGEPEPPLIEEVGKFREQHGT